MSADIAALCAFFWKLWEAAILAVSGGCLCADDTGSIFRRLQTGAVSAGSGDAGGVEKFKYDLGYKKGFFDWGI